MRNAAFCAGWSPSGDTHGLRGGLARVYPGGRNEDGYAHGS